MADDRKGFEDWAISQGGFAFSTEPNNGEVGEYISTVTQSAWEAWCFQQSKIDTLIFDRTITRSLYSNASREIERLRQESISQQCVTITAQQKPQQHHEEEPAGTIHVIEGIFYD